MHQNQQYHSASRTSVISHMKSFMWSGFRNSSSPFSGVQIAGLVHQSLEGVAPAYLIDDCRLLSDASRRPLRSSSSDIRTLVVPRTHNKFGDTSFSVDLPVRSTSVEWPTTSDVVLETKVLVSRRLEDKQIKSWSWSWDPESWSWQKGLENFQDFYAFD